MYGVEIACDLDLTGVCCFSTLVDVDRFRCVSIGSATHHDFEARW